MERERKWGAKGIEKIVKERERGGREREREREREKERERVEESVYDSNLLELNDCLCVVLVLRVPGA